MPPSIPVVTISCSTPDLEWHSGRSIRKIFRTISASSEIIHTSQRTNTRSSTLVKSSILVITRDYWKAQASSYWKSTQGYQNGYMPLSIPVAASSSEKKHNYAETVSWSNMGCSTDLTLQHCCNTTHHFCSHNIQKKVLARVIIFKFFSDQTLEWYSIN